MCAHVHGEPAGVPANTIYSDGLLLAALAMEFFNYDELFSFPVTRSYYSLYSMFNENSAQISVNHSDYSDFVHFSSAEERLRNFKYKLELIESHEGSIATIESTGCAKIGTAQITVIDAAWLRGMIGCSTNTVYPSSLVQVNDVAPCLA